MGEKHFKLKADELKQLVQDRRGCFAPDSITVEGLKVKFMFRDKPSYKFDSGWQFFSAKDTEEYINNAENMAIYAINTIANYDPAIIPYLNFPIGSDLERIEGTDLFRLIPG